jgi:hypothetical protein
MARAVLRRTRVAVLLIPGLIFLAVTAGERVRLSDIDVKAMLPSLRLDRTENVLVFNPTAANFNLGDFKLDSSVGFFSLTVSHRLHPGGRDHILPAVKYAIGEGRPGSEDAFRHDCVMNSFDYARSSSRVVNGNKPLPTESDCDIALIVNEGLIASEAGPQVSPFKNAIATLSKIDGLSQLKALPSANYHQESRETDQPKREVADWIVNPTQPSVRLVFPLVFLAAILGGGVFLWGLGVALDGRRRRGVFLMILGGYLALSGPLSLDIGWLPLSYFWRAIM